MSASPIRPLDRLLRPKTIAFFGGKEAAEAIRQCRAMGYGGEIWPVHPRKTEVEGHPCYASLDDLPAMPDAAFIGVNRNLTIALVQALSERGAGGAVCYASGFKEAAEESADGIALQEALLNAAGDMPILGPNCYGLINYMDAAILWPDQHGGARTDTGVAILTQSSNMAINLTMQKRGLPIAYIAALGNQAQIGLSDLGHALLDDPRVTALGLHIEGLDDPGAFEAMALKARARGIPIVAIKMGKSEAAQTLTLSHTASLAGSDQLVDAVFKRLGIARVNSLPALLESLKLLHVHGPLPGTSISSMSCSGGEASLMADSAEGRAVSFRPLNAQEVQTVKTTLNELVAVANPLDYHTFIWGDEDAMAATYSAMMANGFDLNILVLDFPRIDRCRDDDWQAAINGFARASKATKARAAILTSLPENLPENRARELIQRGIAPMMGIDDTYDAIEAAAFIAESWQAPAPAPLLLPKRPADGENEETTQATLLDEDQSKTLLAAHGVPFPERTIVTTREDALLAAETLGYPVVLKIVRADLAHKSDIGGVAINLQDAENLGRAFDSMAHLGDRFMVEAMIRDGIAELIVGLNHDRQFGLHLIVGAGGVLVDLLQDSQILPLPTTGTAIRRAILALKASPLLTGYRGKPHADIDAAISTIEAIAHFAESAPEGLIELDVNPLILKAEGQGAMAADALIRQNVPASERQNTIEKDT